MNKEDIDECLSFKKCPKCQGSLSSSTSGFFRKQYSLSCIKCESRWDDSKSFLIDIENAYKMSQEKTYDNKLKIQSNEKSNVQIQSEPSPTQVELSNIIDIKKSVKVNNTQNSNIKPSTIRYKEKKVDSISGVGQSYSMRLKNAGIITISDLLAATNTPNELREIQSSTGIYTKMLENWRSQADFLRIYGLSKKNIDNLTKVGIESTNHLASIKPMDLREEMLVKLPYSEVPSLGVIKRWVRIANELLQID